MLEDADQALVVEVEAIEESGWQQAQVALHRRVHSVIDAVGPMAGDLEILMDDWLPDPARGGIRYMVRARVLEHLDAGGPDVGDTFAWPYGMADSLLGPGDLAVVFVARKPPPLALFGWTTVEGTDAVTPLRGMLDPEEVLSAVRSGLERRRAGKPLGADWLAWTVRAPSARALLDIEGLSERLPPSTIAEAMLTHPTGLWNEPVLLQQLVDVPHDGLDRFALDLADAWLENGYTFSAATAIKAAIDRWRLPVPSEEVRKLRRLDAEALRNFWSHLRATHGLPEPEQHPLLRGQIEGWSDEAERFHEAANIFAMRASATSRPTHP